MKIKTMKKRKKGKGKATSMKKKKVIILKRNTTQMKKQSQSTLITLKRVKRANPAKQPKIRLKVEMRKTRNLMKRKKAQRNLNPNLCQESTLKMKVTNQTQYQKVRQINR